MVLQQDTASLAVEQQPGCPQHMQQQRGWWNDSQQVCAHGGLSVQKEETKALSRTLLLLLSCRLVPTCPPAAELQAAGPPPPHTHTHTQVLLLADAAHRANCHIVQ